MEELKQVWKHLPHTEQRLRYFESLSPEELEEKRKKLPSFPIAARKVLKKTVKNLPHDHGGRPRVLTDELRRMICGDVAAFIESAELIDAQRRAAAKYGVSLRSVQRAWQRRPRQK